jgi:hypothetical protein
MRQGDEVNEIWLSSRIGRLRRADRQRYPKSNKE